MPPHVLLKHVIFNKGFRASGATKGQLLTSMIAQVGLQLTLFAKGLVAMSTRMGFFLRMHDHMFF